MAKVKLTRGLTRRERTEIAELHNNQIAVRDGRKARISDYDGFFSTWANRSFDDVKIVEMKRCADPELPQYGFLEPRLDLGSPVTWEIVEWIREDDTWIMTREGVLRCNAIKLNPTHPARSAHESNPDAATFGKFTPEAYYSLWAEDPEIDIWLDRLIDAATVIVPGYLPALNKLDELFKPKFDAEPDIFVKTHWSDDTDSYGGKYHYRGSNAYPQEGDLWTFVDNRHRLHGFNIHRQMKGFIGSGSETLALRALGVANDAEISRIKHAPEEKLKARRGSRFIDVGGEVLDRNSVGKFPFTVQGPDLTDYRYENDNSGYRRRSKTYNPYASGCRPIVLGLSRSHDYFKALDHYAMVEQWPMLSGTNAPFNGMNDMLLVTRSPLGWHGLFVLKAIVRNKGVPEAVVAYLVPTFLPIMEARNTKAPMLFRRLDRETKAGIEDSFGMADFLQQSLYTLQGVKAKLARAGHSLDDLQKKRLPDGHLIRSWGLARKDFAYDVEDAPHNRPRKFRIERTAARLLGVFGERANVPFGVVDLPANDIAPLQPVASKRVLEL